MNPLSLIPSEYLGIAKIVAVLALVAALIGGYFAWHHNIFEQGVTQEKDRRDKIDAENTIKAQATLAAANEKVRVTQASLTDTLAQIDVKNKELENAKSQVAALRADVRSGAVRMSIPIATGSCRAAGSPDSAAAASGTGTETRAELLPTTADDLIELVTDADSEVRRTNECIDRYGAVKAASDALQAAP